jgi:hypothetical protein
MWIDQLPSVDLGDRSKAFDHASTITRLRIERWLQRIEPEADALYRNATLRFASLANHLLSRLTESRDPAFATLPRSLDPEVRLREERHFYATSLMHLTAPGFINRLADLLLPRDARLGRIKRDASACLERLLRSNVTRLVFDLEQRVEVSRRTLESELRLLPRQVTSPAERALERARVRQQAGREAVAGELAKVDALRERLDRINDHAARD